MSMIFLMLYNLVILAGTVYLIVEYDWSAWWMLFAVCVLGTSRSSKE